MTACICVPLHCTQTASMWRHTTFGSSTVFLGDGVVDVETHYKLTGPRIESRTAQTGHEAHPPVQRVPALPRRQSGRGVSLTTHPI